MIIINSLFFCTQFQRNPDSVVFKSVIPHSPSVPPHQLQNMSITIYHTDTEVKQVSSILESSHHFPEKLAFVAVFVIY